MSSPVEDKIVDSDQKNEKTGPAIFTQSAAIERGQECKAQEKQKKPEVKVGKPRSNRFCRNVWQIGIDYCRCNRTLRVVRTKNEGRDRFVPSLILILDVLLWSAVIRPVGREPSRQLA